jgi:hypothetical protein
LGERVLDGWVRLSLADPTPVSSGNCDFGVSKNAHPFVKEVQTKYIDRGTIPLSKHLESQDSTTGVRPMFTRVIHFGPDDCHRLMVLRSAGYEVEDCDSPLQLSALLSSGASAEAVIMSDGEGVSHEEALAVARTHSNLPLILFRSTNRAYEEFEFDLVVQVLTPPEAWLNDVDALIERTRATVRA